MRSKIYLFIILTCTTIFSLLYYFEIHNSSVVRLINYQFYGNNENFIEKKNYSLLECTIEYKMDNIQNYNLKVSKELEDVYLTRGVVIYFPINSFNHFFIEFKWLYRSWIEMQKYESNKWRTDLILFIDDTNLNLFNNSFKELKNLNCTFENKRLNKYDRPMCILIPYRSIADRVIDKGVNKMKFLKKKDEYKYLLNDIDVFNDLNKTNFNFFYYKLKDLSHYGYVDSILIAFEGYKQLNGVYDFLLRSDMDVFLTPLFGKWLPRKCNDFIVGGGGYSNDFNINRLERIAKNLNLEFASEWNLGSTWYSTPKQFRFVSYLTLIAMTYLSNEEFSSVEREGKLGVQLWPEWHYGVLLLYGQNIAMNHLIATKQINIVKLPNLIDYPSANDKSVFESVHIHVFHGDSLFSKFSFKTGKYDNMIVNENDKFKTRFYALSNALDAKIMTSNQLFSLFLNQTTKI